MGKKQTAGQTPVRVAVKDLPTIRIDELVPYANNAKIHGPEQIEPVSYTHLTLPTILLV